MVITVNLSKVLLVNNEDIPTKLDLSFQQNPTTLENLISKLNQLYPSIDFNKALVIMNGKIISDSQTQIHHKDIVNFFPPVMGG